MVTVNLSRSRGRPMAPPSAVPPPRSLRRRCRATSSLVVAPAGFRLQARTHAEVTVVTDPALLGRAVLLYHWPGGLAMARPWDGIMPVKREQDGRIRVQRAVLANSESHAKLTHTSRSRLIERLGPQGKSCG